MSPFAHAHHPATLNDNNPFALPARLFGPIRLLCPLAYSALALPARLFGTRFAPPIRRLLCPLTYSALFDLALPARLFGLVLPARSPIRLRFARLLAHSPRFRSLAH